MSDAEMDTPIPQEPLDFTTVEGVDRNPALKRTRSGTPPAKMPVDPKFIAKSTTLPVLKLSWSTMMENVEAGQVEAITKRRGSVLLALPIRAGTRFYKDNPNATTDIANVINTLDVRDPSEVGQIGAAIVTKLAAAGLRSKNRAHAGPFPLLVADVDDATRAVLLFLQTFDVSPTLAFHIVEVDPDFVSWTIMMISAPGHGIITEKNKDAILVDIKRQLFENTHFFDTASAILRKRKVGGSSD
jgi:hypothetical protein